MPRSMNADPLFRKGLKIRKEVQGAARVTRRMRETTRYTLPLEDFTIKSAWGLVWSRPGLSRKIRSFLNLGILTALNQPAELKLHIGVALHHGITRDEIAEAVLHTAVYCGIPRAAEARRAMCAVFDELDAQNSKAAPRARSRRKT